MSSLLSIHNLSIGFDAGGGSVQGTERGGSRSGGKGTAGTVTPGVEGVTLDVRRGEIVALVGESGSGKSITALSILGLLPAPPARVLTGAINFLRRDGKMVDLLKQPPAVLQQIRGGEIGMIFQEPMTSLNPVYTC